MMSETQLLTASGMLVAALFGALAAIVGWIGSRVIEKLDEQVINIRIIQDGTGNRTLAYGSKYKFPGGAPVLSTAASAKDFLSCQYDALDDTLFCSLMKALS